MDALPVLAGVVLGLVIYYVAIHPGKLRAHERRRRAYGLPPKRRLPEDP